MVNRKMRRKGDLPEPQMKEAPGLEGAYVVSCGRAEILINKAGRIELEDEIEPEVIPEMIAALRAAQSGLAMAKLVQGVAERVQARRQQAEQSDE